MLEAMCKELPTSVNLWLLLMDCVRMCDGMMLLLRVWESILIKQPLESNVKNISLVPQHVVLLVKYKLTTTLNIVFSITYYLELLNAVSIYCISHILPIILELVVWHYRLFTSLLGKNLYQ